MKDLSKENQENFQETLKINTLLEINKALGSSLDLKSSLSNVMNILASRLTMSQGSLILLDSETKELIMEVVYGPNKQGIEDGDIHKKVFESGLPAAISSLGGPPLFLDSSKISDIKKQDISYLCVPMKIEGMAMGVLIVDRLFDDSVEFNEDLILLNSITSIIAQTINIYYTAEKEKKDLIRENKYLRLELEKLKDVNTIDRHELRTNPQKQLSIEKVLEKKLDEIITVMDVTTEGKRRLYDDIISNVEKILIKLALKRTKNIKYEAARFLGINRNTLYKKMNDLNISV
ncbi:MAG: helix-turn-helix domain-containing protein [Thermodesulfobacteriota bacterium]